MVDGSTHDKHKKVRVGIAIPAWQKDALEKISGRTGRSVSDLIRQQVSAYLETFREPGIWTEEPKNPPKSGERTQ